MMAVRDGELAASAEDVDPHRAPLRI